MLPLDHFLRSSKCVVAAALSALAVQLRASEGQPVGSATLDLATAYLFRGATVTDTYVAQPSLKAEILPSLTIGVWGNMDLDSDGGRYRTREFSEVDLTASYAIPIERPSLSLGYVEYLYPHSDIGPDRELFVSAGVDVLLHPTVTGYWGVDGAVHRELYAEVSIAHSFDLAEGLALDLSAVLAGRYSDRRETGLSHAVLAAALRYGVVKAGVAWVPVLDRDVLPDDVHNTEVVGTLSFNVDF